MPFSRQAFSTTLMPPKGLMARRSNSSVCKPTITSFSLSIYPGANEVMVETVEGSSERTPLLARSSAKASKHLFHTAFVRSVGPVRKEASPS